MKYVIILISILVLNTKQDQLLGKSMAWKAYSENLEVVKNSVNHKEGLNIEKIKQAIAFFEKLTNIKSESPGDFIGQYRPTKNDYKNWKHWFKINKKRLNWNTLTKQIVLLSDTSVLKQ